MRFTITVGFAARFATACTATAASAFELAVTFGLAGHWGTAFVFTTFLADGFFAAAFTDGFDANFFTLATDLDLTFNFGLLLDFTAMTHILSWFIETPSASFLTIKLLRVNRHFLRR
jgi:hypothetical protein